MTRPTEPDRRTDTAPSTDDFVAAASAAARRWGLDPTSVEILSRSENVVCDVRATEGRRVVLRLHRPGYNTIDELRSEVEWVRALGAAGLPVPQSVPTVDGSHYATIEVGGETRHVGVIEWVDGQPVGDVFEAGSADVVGHYGRIGELAAGIRAHNHNWQPTAEFVRRRWDADALMGQAPLWGRFWEVEALSDAQRALFAEARAQLYETLSSLSTGPDRFGLIHADLHLGNLMADGRSLTVIDFDDSGFGWFAHELAVALHPSLDDPWFGDAREALIAGYRRVHALDDDEARLIDTFLAVRSLMIVGWLNDRPELPVHAQFATVAAEAEGVTRRFLTDGRF